MLDARTVERFQDTVRTQRILSRPYPGNINAAFKQDGPRWYLARASASTIRVNPAPWTQAEFAAVISSSSLSDGAKETMRATALTANARGVTTVDRATVSAVTGLSTWTTTQHWKSAEQLGLMLSKPRFNNTSVRHLGPEAFRTPPFEASIMIQFENTWTAADHQWHTTANKYRHDPPWGAGRPPF